MRDESSALLLREAEVLDFAFLDQVLDRSGHLFDGDIGVNPVLIEQINNIGLEPFE